MKSIQRALPPLGRSLRISEKDKSFLQTLYTRRERLSMGEIRHSIFDMESIFKFINPLYLSFY